MIKCIVWLIFYLNNILSLQIYSRLTHHFMWARSKQNDRVIIVYSPSKEIETWRAVFWGLSSTRLWYKGLMFFYFPKGPNLFWFLTSAIFIGLTFITMCFFQHWFIMVNLTLDWLTDSTQQFHAQMTVCIS